MTTSVEAPAVQEETRDALLAYLDALALAESIQARLWQEAEVTLTQLSVLRELRQGPQTAGRLGHAVGLSPTSVTRLVDRLERRGLVSRRRESEDRRCVQIQLEPAGERLLGQIRVLRGTDLHQAVDSMTGDERRRLTSSLRRLVELTRSRAAAGEINE
ncbi:MAG: MarR family transcriptional regulator [Candidatus Dormibacteraceae bacterium]